MSAFIFKSLALGLTDDLLQLQTPDKIFYDQSYYTSFMLNLKICIEKMTQTPNTIVIINNY